jgi:hypothetical protein
MTRFETVLIDPEPSTLAQTLARAAASANQRARARALAWPPEDYAAFEEALAGQAEGGMQWSQEERAGRSDAPRSIVAVAWWTDCIGRKHLRIVALRTGLNRTQRRNALTHGEERPALWAVYPDQLYLRQEKDQWVLHAACDCGAAGSPQSLGWMGQRCALCHDRLESGEKAPDLEGTVMAGLAWPARALAFGRGGHRLYWLEGAEPEVWVWLRERFAPKPFTLPADYGGYTVRRTLVMSPDQRSLISSDNSLLLHDLRSTNPATRLPASAYLCDDVVFTPDGQHSLEIHFIRCTGTSDVMLRSLTEKRGQKISPPHPHMLLDRLALAPDGAVLALGSNDGTLFLQRFPDGGVLRSWEAHQPGVRPGAFSRRVAAFQALAFSPDGRWLVSSGRDLKVRLWNPATGEEHSGFREKLTGGQLRIAFSPDSAVLATGGPDGVLRLFETNTGKLHGAYRWHPGRITALAFAPAGDWLATAGSDQTIKLWPWPLLVK